MTSTASEDTGISHDEHLRLSGLIKGVHSSLRKKFQESGNFEEVWKDHCKNETVLQEYAFAMHRLAEDYWSKNPQTRIDWCRATCLEYFFKAGLEKVLEKEERKRHFEALRRNSETQLQHLDSQAKERKFSMPVHSTGDLSGEAGAEGYPHNAAELQVMLRDLELPGREECRRPSDFGMLTSISDIDGCCESEDKLDDDSSRLAAGTPSNLTDLLPSSHVSVDLPPSSLSLATGPGPEDSNGKCKKYQEESIDKCRQFVASQQEFLQDHLISQEGDIGDGVQQTEPGNDKPLWAKYGHPKYNTIMLPFQGKIRLLDVGSCFNPFLHFDEFLALGIDISPAVESVYKCDFLHLELTEPLQLAPDTVDTFLHNLPGHIERLPSQTFHVIVFSLLLEYFPSPYQRWLSCQKAHELLMLNGLLLIITPDSNHQQKNAPMIRCWRTAIESLGFARWRYVKMDHLHCLAFRKVALPDNDLVQDVSPDLMYIPQDFNTDSDDQLFSDLPRTDHEDEFLRDNFMELPECDI